MSKRAGVGRIATAVATACVCLGVASPATAQVGRPSTASSALAPSAPRIEAFDVEQVRRLAPGVPLVFTVYGSPGAVATLAIGDRLRDVPMREAEPGVYEATVTPQERDRVTADVRVVATLRHGDRVVREPLREPLVLGGSVASDVGDGDGDGGAADRFAREEPAPTRRASSDAPSRRGGTPVPLATATGPAMPLTTTSAPSPAPVAIGPDDTWRPSASARSPGPAPAAPPSLPAETVVSRRDAPAVLACADCAIVESVRAIEGDDTPQRAGAFASSVTGSVLGERFGEAHGRRITRIWNVLSGRRADADGATRWEVVLRPVDGGTIVRRYDARPPFAVGETVRLGVGVAPAGPLDAAGR